MPGIRLLAPPGIRNVRYTVVESANPYPVPYTCTPPTLGGCGSTHLFKTHHLNIDDTGHVIVSTGVYERISSRLALDGYVLANEVARPPALILNGKPDVPVPVLFSPSNMEGH